LYHLGLKLMAQYINTSHILGFSSQRLCKFRWSAMATTQSKEPPFWGKIK
jgi:hypothetical protein